MTAYARHWESRLLPGALWLQQQRRLRAPVAPTAVSARDVGHVSGASLAFLGISIGGYFLQRAYSTVTTLIPLVADPGEQGTLVRYGPLVALVASVVLLGVEKLLTPVAAKYRPWLVLLTVWTVGLAFAGLLRQNPRYYFMVDLEVLIVLLSGILLGARREMWPFLERAYVWVLGGGIIVVLLGLRELDLIAMRFGGKFLAVAYDSQYVLWPVCFFVLLYSSLRRGPARAIVLLAFGMCLLEQLLFQKRAPTARLLISVGLAVLVTFFATRARAARLVIALPAMIAGALLALVFFAAVLRLPVGGVTDAFLLRVTQAQRADEATSLENARFRFAARLVSSLEGNERWFGKGLGGYIVDQTFGYYILTSQGIETRGAASIEVGHTWAILKGGYLFLPVFYLMFVAALTPRDVWGSRGTPLDRAAWVFVAISVLFLFVESFMHHPNQLYWLLVGAAIGRLTMSRPAVFPSASRRLTRLPLTRELQGPSASCPQFTS